MRAMLPTFREKEVDVVLIYSVRTPAEAAFAAEFQEAAAAGGVRIIYTVTGAYPAWVCVHHGREAWLPLLSVLAELVHTCMLCQPCMSL